MPTPHRNLGEHMALVEVIDRVLGKGAVIGGEVVVAVADIDLVRIQLQLLLGSVDALGRREQASAGEGVAP